MIFKSKPTYDYLVVGLGNPGFQYEKTRHNVGFMALDSFAEKEGATLNKNKYNALIGEVKLKDLRILLVKPQTFMNNSGSAVSAIASFYKISPEKIIVLFDDISLPVGNIRIRRKGSHGGHNGMKDIVELLGNDNILRIKIGIGDKPHPDYDLASWVLGKFPKEEIEQLDKAIDKTVSALKEIMLNGVDSAMNKFNS